MKVAKLSFSTDIVASGSLSTISTIKIKILCSSLRQPKQLAVRNFVINMNEITEQNKNSTKIPIRTEK
jgi:hypothetical protein